MTKRKYPSQVCDKFVLRFPEEGKREFIKERAAKNRRSMNSELLHLIESGLKADKRREASVE